MKRLVWFFSLLTILSLTLAACGAVTPAFTDLPAPVGGKYPTVSITKTIGDTMDSSLQSPLISVEYGETHGGPGGVAMEKTTILSNGLNGQLVETAWGDIAEGTIKLTESYDPQGNLIEGRISLKLNAGSIFQWFKGCFGCVIDQSRVIISYIAPEPGATPILRDIYYFQNWGSSSNNVFAMGDAARWSNPAEAFPEYTTWGFWESYNSTDMVIDALYATRDRLQTYTPTVKVVDEDSLSEVIGRQTGLHVYLNGVSAGTVDFTFKNNFGHMPNTNFVGNGSLSRVEFKFGDVCQTISVINPPFPNSFSSLFVFEDCSVADQVESASVLSLYPAIRNGSIPGIHFAVYANGYIGNVPGVTSAGDSVNIGQGGGVFYSVIGDPSLDQLVAARNLISMMGRGGVDASGFGYATETLSGNGIEYYLGTIILAKASPENQLVRYGFDSGLLDRSGYLTLP